MARARTAAWLEGYSGVIGNVVASQTQDGVVLRARWMAHGRRSEAQLTHEGRMRVVNALWDDLTREECAAWRGYAVSLSSRNPQTGGLKIPKAHGLLCGLGTKYLQVHGGHEVPRLPPTGRFLGDVLTVTVASEPPPPSGSIHRRGHGVEALTPLPCPPLPNEPSGEGAFLLFSADGTNREGVLTELLGQRLSGPNNLPKAKSYKSLGFVAFEAGVPVALPVTLGGPYACAARFVEASSGRMTEMAEIGTARVG